MRLVLASASPARRRLLENAGFAPEVVVSGIDEDTPDLAALSPEGLALVLAERKAVAVAAKVTVDGRGPAVVIGCDSVLDVGGTIHGKPASVDEARSRLQALRNLPAVLRTGHYLVATSSGERASAVASTTVWFGDYDDEELEAYLATGEPLQVAGAFTLDGYAAPFIGGVEGDPSNVIGLSLPLFRTMLRRVGLRVQDLWVRP